MKLLIITTSCDTLAPKHPTGLWLEEFAVPYQEFAKAGVSMVVASPKGGAVPIDPKTQPNEKQSREWRDAMAALANTRRLAEMQEADFDAVYIPGGHGPMIDLPNDADILRLLPAFARAGKIISAVCHGPAALLYARGGNGNPLIRDKKLTGFTNVEETMVLLRGVVPFLLEDELQKQGAIFESAIVPFTSHVVQDGNLITGQNPGSSKAIAEAILGALHEKQAAA